MQLTDPQHIELSSGKIILLSFFHTPMSGCRFLWTFVSGHQRKGNFVGAQDSDQHNRTQGTIKMERLTRIKIKFAKER